MEDRETARMRKYGESKTTRIMMATVPHVTSGLGLRKFQADGFLLTRVYMFLHLTMRALSTTYPILLQSISQYLFRRTSYSLTSSNYMRQSVPKRNTKIS